MDNAKLRIENDIMKLKMQAEFGASFSDFTGLPPEIERDFLKMVRNVERMEREAPMVTVYEYLGSPSMPATDALTDAAIVEELARLHTILGNNDISVVTLRDYDPRFIYRFITEELFYLEIHDVRCPGMVSVFCYESFHPGPEEEIESIARSFLWGWQHLDWTSLEDLLAAFGTIPGKGLLDHQEFLKHVQAQAARYERIEFFSYQLEDVFFESDDKEIDLGHATGKLRYLATSRDGQTGWLEGNFRFYCSRSEDGWRLYYFDFPGFSWE